MSTKTWLQLEAEGWSRETNDRNEVIYKRPSGRKVRRKRDLNETELIEFGDTLFPGKRQKIHFQYQPIHPTAPDNTRRSDVFSIDEPEAINEVRVSKYVEQNITKHKTQDCFVAPLI